MIKKLNNEEKVVALNKEIMRLESQIYEHDSYMYKVVLKDGSELFSKEHRVYAGTHLNKLSGYEINLDGEITNNLPLKSEDSILLSNFDNSENVASINGGFILSTIIPECSFGGNNLLLRKCLSNVNITLDSDLAILDNCLSVNPDETFLIPCPSFINKSSTAFGKFSSERNLSLFFEKDIFFFSDEFRSVCHNREDSRFCKLRKIVFENVFNSNSCSEQLHDLPNHDPCTFESGGSTTDFTINDNMLVNFDSHNYKYTDKLYKSFSLQPITDVYSEFNNKNEKDSDILKEVSKRILMQINFKRGIK